MKAALLMGGMALMLVPAIRVLRRSSSTKSDAEYFAAARKRAIAYRLAQTAASKQSVTASGE